MASPSPPGTKQHTEHDNNWLPTVASLAVGTAFFALWFWLLPFWSHLRIDTAGVAPWRWIAALPAVLGFAVASRCIWDFGRTGHGTPAPMIPPKKLVVVGFYRFVRNPMYLGFITGWIGLRIVFGQANLVAFVIAFAVVLGVAFLGPRGFASKSGDVVNRTGRLPERATGEPARKEGPGAPTVSH
jgi:protein-S-isoprenylcysteine O-methyltransferase Ste14